MLVANEILHSQDPGSDLGEMVHSVDTGKKNILRARTSFLPKSYAQSKELGGGDWDKGHKIYNARYGTV